MGFSRAFLITHIILRKAKSQALEVRPDDGRGLEQYL